MHKGNKMPCKSVHLSHFSSMVIQIIKKIHHFLNFVFPILFHDKFTIQSIYFFLFFHRFFIYSIVFLCVQMELSSVDQFFGIFVLFLTVQQINPVQSSVLFIHFLAFPPFFCKTFFSLCHSIVFASTY